MAFSFDQKLGPLPVWGWTVIGAGVAGVGYFLYRRYESAKIKSTSTSSSTTNTGLTTSQYNQLESQIAGLYGANGQYGYGSGGGFTFPSGTGTGTTTGTTSTTSVASTSTNTGTSTQTSGGGSGTSVTPTGNTSSTTTNTTPPATTSSGGTVPNNAAVSTVSNGHSTSYSNGGTVFWTANGPATSWQVTLTGPGSENGRTAVVHVTQASYSGLEHNHNYEVSVQPLPTGQPGSIHFFTG